MNSLEANEKNIQLINDDNKWIPNDSYNAWLTQLCIYLVNSGFLNDEFCHLCAPLFERKVKKFLKKLTYQRNKNPKDFYFSYDFVKFQYRSLFTNFLRQITCILSMRYHPVFNRFSPTSVFETRPACKKFQKRASDA
jgi:hypothetical protein